MNTTQEVRFSLIKRNGISGFLPNKAESLSTGYDVKNAGPDLILRPFEHALIPLGIKALIPEGWWLFLVPRSSSHGKKHLHTLYGVVDESYEGELFFSAQYIPITNDINTVSIEYNITERTGYYGEVYKEADVADVYDVAKFDNLTIKHGDAVAQLILMPRYEMNVIGVTEDEYKELTTKRGATRGTGGFGSTDKK